MKRPLNKAGINYPSTPLVEERLPKNPFILAEEWIDKALESAPSFVEPNAMTLCTVSKESKPSCREVLLKGFDSLGFTFFTNYKSQKAMDIEHNPFVASSFYWSWIFLQLRIEGRIEKIDVEMSKKYFYSRPISRQIAARASKQSQDLKSRKELLEKVERERDKFKNQVVPYPDDWGGFKIYPSKFEFWQGQPDRLHDRIVYEKFENSWEMHRIYP